MAMKVRLGVGVAVGAAAALSASIVTAQMPPNPRVGLWRSEGKMASQAVVSEMCIDTASQSKMSSFGASIRADQKCQNQVSRTPSGWTDIATCHPAGAAVRVIKTDVVGDMNSKYTMTMRSPPSSAPMMVTTSTFEGPCRPGMKGGDMIMNGHTYKAD